MKKLIFLSLLLSSCLGVEGEGLYERFKGIDTITQLSPYTVKLNWIGVKNVEKYEVFISTSDAPIGVTANTEFTVENLEPNRQYIFAVNAVYFDGREEGISFEKNIVMWDKFRGLTSATSISHSEVDLAWDYKYDNVRYYVYYAKINDNFDFSNSNSSSTSNQVRITNLTGDTTYKFIVRATYADGTSDDNINVVSTKTMIGISPMPVINISLVTVGSLPSVNIERTNTSQLIKIHRLDNNILVCEKKVSQTNVICYNNTLSKGLNNLYAIVTDAVGNTARVDDLKTVVKSIDLNAPSLKPYYNISKPFVSLFESPRGGTDGGYNTISLLESRGFTNANNIRSGDFNCDGFDDLVIGVPGGTYNSESYCTDTSSTSTTTVCEAKSRGYFLIYYGASSGFNEEPDLIYSFQNETSGGLEYDHPGGWGYNISIGNFNNDSHEGRACSDLAISSNIHNYRGAFAIFYGNPSGLQVGIGTTDLVRLHSAGYAHCSGSTCLRAFFTPSNISTSYNNRFGSSLASGDIDGDGYDDLVVGMYDYTNNNNQRVYIFFGSSSGLGILDGSVKYIVIRNETNKNIITKFGANIAISNTSNDTQADLYVTSLKNDSSVWQGKLLYFNSNTIKDLKTAGLNSGQNLFELEDLTYTEIGIHPNALSLNSTNKPSFTFIDRAGDINNDGYEDIVIASNDDRGVSSLSANLYAGAFYVIYGGSSGPQISNGYINGGSACNAFNTCSIQRIASLDRTLQCTGASSNYCYYAPKISYYDLNQDGYSDLMVSFPYKPKNVSQYLRGELHIYYGSSTGMSSIPRRLIPNKDASTEEFDINDMFGYSSVAAKFMGSSSNPQIVATAFKKDMKDEQKPEEITPMAYLISQRIAQGGAIETFQPIDKKVYDRKIKINYSKFENRSFDNLVYNLGDINGDGYDDVVMKTYSYYSDNNTGGNPTAIIYYGSSIGLVTEENSTCISPSLLFTYDDNNLICPQILSSKYIYDELNGEQLGYFGDIVHSAGDVNGDGYSDIVTVSTAVNLFYGSSYGPIIETAPSTNPLYYTDPKIVNIATGTGILTTASFLKGLDAYGRYYYNGYWHSNGIFNRILNGDFNGDGFDDIVFFSGNDGVIILYGSSTGIQSDGYLKIYDELNQEGSILESYKIGEANYPSQCEGEIPNLICYGARIRPRVLISSVIVSKECQAGYMDIAGACSSTTYLYGNALGDINGDGIDDLSLVLPWGGGTGSRVFIYYGSKKGLVLNGTSHPENASLVSPQAIQLYDLNNNYGFINLSGYAGDINGDGFNDFVLGGSRSGNRMFVFYGGINGLQTFSNDASNLPNTYSSFSGSTEGLAKFSRHASCTGEPSSGFNDICNPLLINNPSLGNHTINGAGLSGTMGVGDINGDGYDDILQTFANCYKNDIVHTGCAVLYFGSKYGLRAYNVTTEPDGTVIPVNQLANISTSPTCSSNKHGVACSPLMILPDIPYLQLTKKSYFLSGDYDGDGSTDLLFGSKNIFYHYNKSGPDPRLENLTDKTSTGHLWYMYR